MESRRITILGAVILITLTVAAGVVVYAIMERQAESILSTSLELSLQSRAHLFEAKLRTQLHRNATVATRPFLLQQIEKIDGHPGDTQATFYLQRGINSFLDTGFTALAIVDANGHEVVHAGHFSAQPQLTIPIRTQEHSRLLWDHGFVLESRVAMRDAGQVVGYIRAQSDLPTLTRMLFDISSLGRTGELAICSPLSAQAMQCFPSTLHRTLFPSLARKLNGKRLPMDYALDGNSGVIRTKDYRGKGVVAAYMPLGATGLGMVLKIDQSELFSPVVKSLSYVLPTLVLLVLFGVLILRWLVAPLIARVVASEREMREVNEQLAENEARIRSVLDNVDDAIVVLGADGRIESVNSGAERIFGYGAVELLGQDVSILAPEDETMGARHDIYEGMRRGDSSVLGRTIEVGAVRKNGTAFPMEMRLNEMRLGCERLFIAIMRDITQRKQADEKIMHLATHDTLTGLPNRNLLRDRVEQAISHADRQEGIRVALLFIDLDGFKQVNDEHGHEMGDRLLVEASARIRCSLRSEDTVARQGGDEFIVALPNLKEISGAAVVANKLLDALSAPYAVDGTILNIDASIGIALYPDDGTEMEMLLKHSDTAMYAAKMQGRGTFRFYDEETGFSTQG